MRSHTPSLKAQIFCFGILCQLLGYGLYLSGLNIEFALENVRGAKRTHARLITLDRRQVVNAGFFQKSAYFFHNL